MEVSEAIEKASNHSDIKALHGYFLGSCFAVAKKSDDKIEDWTLMYYDSKTGKAVDCFVNKKFVTASKETRSVSPVEKMELSGLKITIERALEIAQNKFARGTINILITLHTKKALVWSISMIGVDLTVTTYDIDAKSGKILEEESTSLIRKLDKNDPL